jgi:FolB domain-containing protein
MDQIIIQNLEVFYRVGVPKRERAKPQRLLLTLQLEHDFGPAAKGDDLRKTIDYDAVARRLSRYGQARSWKLIETLAVDVARMVLRQYKPRRVTVEVKKFILPNAAHVAARVTRPLARATAKTQ